jgi:NAD(P)-dependent dehydrogenase (short-subunit alcohol dehydrogenase family)
MGRNQSGTARADRLASCRPERVRHARRSREEVFCQKPVEQSVQQSGGLDIFVNNTGRRQTHASIPDISIEQVDRTKS